jgi:acyl carrier protein
MERNEIAEKIKGVLVAVLKHEDFEMVDSLSAAQVDGWDSLTHMIIITDIENIFSIQFKLKELNKLNNLGNLIDLIISKLS